MQDERVRSRTGDAKAADRELDALKGRGRALGLAVLLGIGLFCLMLAGCMVLLINVVGDADNEPRIKRDDDQLRLTLVRLASVEEAFAVIPVPVGAYNPKSAGAKDCYYSSGVGQPWVERTWTVEPANADRTVASVAESLTRLGWLDASTVGNVVDRTLTRAWGDWSSQAEVGRSIDQTEVWVMGTVIGAAPCSLESRSGH